MAEIIDQTSIQVRFTVKDGADEFTDAIYFTPAEYAAMTAEDIEAAKMARFNAWKQRPTSAVTPSVDSLSEEERAMLAESLRQQQEALAAQLAQLGG